MIRLYSYYRSSASWRVRIALHFKNIPHQIVPVNLLKAEHQNTDHKERNPLATVPVIEVVEPGVAHPVRMAESLAIIQYLEDVHPEPTLFPGNAVHRARIRWLAELVNADIHPLQNLSTLNALETRFGANAEAKKQWAQHWIARGFSAVERVLKDLSGTCCVGDDITLADVCLIPQVYNARRQLLDLAPFPNIVRIVDALAHHPSFHATHPDRQPDTPPPA